MDVYVQPIPINAYFFLESSLMLSYNVLMFTNLSQFNFPQYQMLLKINTIYL